MGESSDFERQRASIRRFGKWVLGLCWASTFLNGVVLHGQATTGDNSALLPLQAAAEKGDAQAQRRLADAYAGQLDSTNAVVWYRKAANQGDAQAQWQLGRYYEFGGGQLP